MIAKKSLFHGENDGAGRRLMLRDAHFNNPFFFYLIYERIINKKNINNDNDKDLFDW